MADTYGSMTVGELLKSTFADGALRPARTSTGARRLCLTNIGGLLAENERYAATS